MLNSLILTVSKHWGGRCGFFSAAKSGNALAVVVLAVGVLVQTGCQPLGGESIVQVIGEVRMDRRPLADAMVVFVPRKFRNRGGTINPLAFGKTNDTGRFELRTSDTKGVAAGDYRLLFFGPFSDRSDAIDFDSDATDRSEDQYEKIEEALSRVVIPFREMDVVPRNRLYQSALAKARSQSVPIQYNLESKLRFTVKPGAGIVYPKFELQSHPEK